CPSVWLKSICEINSSAEAKNSCPLIVYTHFSFILSISTSIFDIFIMKKMVLNKIPTTTPSVRLLDHTTVKTVIIITTTSVFGADFTNLNVDQSNVLTQTINMTPTRAAIGIINTISRKTIINTIKNAPATNVDKRVRPPDFILIIDCPIIPQPAIPPKNTETIFAIPCPLASRFLSLVVSDMSSTTVAVNNDTIKPTIDNEIAYGKMMLNASKLNGTFANKNVGNI